MTAPIGPALTVLALPAFQSNYLWLIHDGSNAAVVDPGDAAPVLAALAEHRLTLTAILLTHHHHDHIDGVPALLRHAPVPVFGPRNEAIATITVKLGEGDRVEVPGLSLALRVLDVPGHTPGHIAYLREGGEDQPWLFCGDVLFAAGCGRVPEGRHAQARASLQKLAALPDDTLVYCAHEYTLANLAFALAAEPGNPSIAARMARETARRERGEPTLPTTIGDEKATNPFLRDQQNSVTGRLEILGKLRLPADPVACFTALREWKNVF